MLDRDLKWLTFTNLPTSLRILSTHKYKMLSHFLGTCTNLLNASNGCSLKEIKCRPIFFKWLNRARKWKTKLDISYIKTPWHKFARCQVLIKEIGIVICAIITQCPFKCCQYLVHMSERTRLGGVGLRHESSLIQWWSLTFKISTYCVIYYC